MRKKRFNCQKCKIRTHFAYPTCKHVTCSRCSFKTKCRYVGNQGPNILKFLWIIRLFKKIPKPNSY